MDIDILMIEYVKIFKDKGRDKNKNKKLMSLHIDGSNLLEKYKAIRTNTSRFKKH